MDEIRLANLFTAVNGVLFRDENNHTAINPDLVLEKTDLGGRHRVRIMDELRTAVNGVPCRTPEENITNVPWYADTQEFIKLAAMAVSNFQRNLSGQGMHHHLTEWKRN